MNTLIDSAWSVIFRDGHMLITLVSGKGIHFPFADNPHLGKGNEAQWNHVELSPFKMHWPDPDEDVSFDGLVKGNFGQGPTEK